MTTGLVVGVAAAFFVAWALTGAARGYALARGILDRPNERSSHQKATPLGGGWGIAVPVIGAIGVALGAGGLDMNAAVALGGGGAAVALVGWVDDRRGLTAMFRLLVQAGSAIWLVAWLGGFDTLDVGAARLPLGRWGDSLAVVAIVWCTNLYNFMDGVDGIAATEAVCVAGAGGVLLVLGGSIGLALIAWATAAASAGFLMWNRPPARIFMGDTGSGFLGFTLAGLAIAGDVRGVVPALVWVVLLGSFVADATTVLIGRIARGEPWYSAHRGHLYQRLVQSGWTHGRVDRALLGLNVSLISFGMIAWTSRAMMPWTLVLAVITITVAFLAANRIIRKSSGEAAGGAAGVV